MKDITEELKSKFEAMIKSDDEDADYININACIGFMQSAYNLGKADEWVSVETALPDETTDVEFYNAGYRAHFIGRLYDKERKIFWDQQADTHTKVTHWKPLTPPNHDK